MRLLILPVLFLLTACPSLVVPETPRETIAAVEASFTAVLSSLEAARQDGLIDEEAEERIDVVVRSVDASLDAAQIAVRGGDTDATDQWLTAARDGIEALRAELREANE